MLKLLAYQGASTLLSSQAGAGGAIDIECVLARGLIVGMYGIVGGVTLMSGTEQTFAGGAFSTRAETGRDLFWAKKFGLFRKR